MTMGLMGVRVEPTLPPAEIVAGRRFATIVETLPQLTAATSWAELRNVPVEGGAVNVRHAGDRSTELTNKGAKAMVWRAAFRGSFATLLVGGKPHKALVRSEDQGFDTSSVEVTVPAGGSAAVKVAS
jgi:hypothetical protein